MRPRQLVILGAGEHARVVADAAASRPEEWQLVGFTTAAPDDVPDPRLGGTWFGDDEAMVARIAALPPADRPWLILGFGTNGAARGAAVARFPADCSWATVIHTAATVSPSARLEAGVVVLARAVVNPAAVIEPHAIVNSGAIVEHDVTVGRLAHIAPGAVIGGGATIGAGAHVGLAAVVRDHVRVGERALVGMGAVVVADVPPDAVVAGNPARAMEVTAR